MSQPEKFLIATAEDVTAPKLLTTLEAHGPAVLLITGSLMSAGRESLLALRQLTAVLTDQPDEISRTNLDGVHLEPARGVKAQRTRFSSLNLGAGGLFSRHLAMQAGEEGADYVGFGHFMSPPGADDFAPCLDLATWWADVMTTPCVLRVSSAREAQAAARGGVDFIACRWQDADDVFNATEA